MTTSGLLPPLQNAWNRLAVYVEQSVFIEKQRATGC